MTIWKEKHTHVFISSVATWGTTTDNRSLADLIKIFEDEGYDYSVFVVPLHHSENYRIEWYAPQVEGTVYAGTFTPKKSKRKRAA